MRLNRVATAVATVSAVFAGLTAAAVVRSRAAAHRRQEPAALRAGARPAAPTAGSPAPAPAPTPAPAAAPPTRPDPTVETGPPADVQLPVGTAAEPEDTREAVVLAFVRPGTAQPAAEQPTAGDEATGQPAAPVRCGDTGGRTKAGAPCGARAGAGGRCRHHPAAA